MLRRPVSLGALLLLPLVGQLPLAIGLMSLFSYLTDQRYHQELERKGLESTSQSVDTYLRGYLHNAQQVIRVMAEAVESGRLNPADRNATASFLWQLHRTFPEAPYLNYGLINGNFIGVGQNNNDSPKLFLEVASKATINKLELFPLDAEGRISGPSQIRPFGDFRSDGWYRQPLVANRPIWTSIYNWVDAPEVMAMGAGMPMRRNGQLVGVAGVDVFLSNIGEFLRSLPLEAKSLVYVVDTQGLLVASSTRSFPFRIVGGRGVRQAAVESVEPGIRDSAKALQKKLGKLGSISGQHDLEVDLEGEPMLVRIHPFRDDAGLDWRIVTVLAEESIAGHLERDLLTNLLVAITIMGISVALGLSSLRRIRATLASLTAASEALTAGDLHTEVPAPAIRELTPLAESFNAMGRQLRESFGQLEAQNASVQQAVVERTLELSQANQRLEEEIAKRSEAELELRRANAELELVANTDRLTGIANRHLFDRLLEQEWKRHGREKQSLSLLLLDVDHFKEYNDTHGHLAGDTCLMEVARAIESGLQRRSDLPARFGGEEFVVLLPNTDSRGGLAVAERIQMVLRERCLHRPQEAAPAFVTASIGIASLQPRAGQQPERLLALADAALYRAKAAGRDTCCL